MFMRKSLIIASVLLSVHTVHAQESRFGEPATDADIAKRFWSVFPDGQFLPEGEGTAVQGAELFVDNCEVCHGSPEEHGIADALFGGIGTLGTDKMLATVGSYWPYSTTVFNYIRRAMPYTSPMSLTNSEYYAITAYLLSANGIIDEKAVINKKTLPKVKMPNRNGFINAYPEIPDKYKTKFD